MKKLTNTIKQMLNGLASADAGEYLTSRQKDGVLGALPNWIDNSRSGIALNETANTSKRRRVALYLGSELPQEVMSYLLETCVSMQHNLIVLTFQTEKTARKLLKPYMQELTSAGINMRLVQLHGEPIPALKRFLKGHAEVAFLACKDNGYLGRKYFQDNEGKNNLPVPVVVIETGKQAVEADTDAAVQNDDKTHVA